MFGLLTAVVTALWPSLVMAQKSSTTPAVPVKPTYTLINEVEIKTKNEMACELIVLSSLDNKEVRILRIDPMKQVYNINYMMDNQSLLSRYGRGYALSNLPETKGLKIKTIQASVNFKPDKHEVILKVYLADNSVFEKRVSVDEDFFKDNSKHCIR